MYRLSFFFAFVLPVPIWFAGSQMELRYKLYEPVGPFFPSEAVSLLTFIILIGAPTWHWLHSRKLERLARRSHQEVLKAVFDLENQMISKQAAQKVAEKEFFFGGGPRPTHLPPPKPKSKGGRPRKPMSPELVAELERLYGPQQPLH